MISVDMVVDSADMVVDSIDMVVDCIDMIVDSIDMVVLSLHTFTVYHCKNWLSEIIIDSLFKSKECHVATRFKPVI